MKIFPPLKADHPLVTAEHPCICPLCQKRFFEGERIVLCPAREVQRGWENIPAVPIHAECALVGANTPVGSIEHIKTGDGSPFPIVTDKGQFTVKEAGYEE